MDSGNRLNFTFDLNREELQSLQDAFCRSNDMYMMCLGRDFETITSFSGSKLEEEFVLENFSTQLRREILSSFTDGNPENVIERYGSEPYLLYRGVGIRGDQGRVLGAWICFGIDGDKTPEDIFLSSELKRTTAEAFDKSISLIETLTHYYCAEKLKAIALKNKLKEEADSGKEMEDRLHKNEIMTDILQLMESDNSFSQVSEEILRAAGEYVDCTHTGLLQVRQGMDLADMICEWVAEGQEPLKDKFQGTPLVDLPFMNGKPYTISSDTELPEAFMIYFGKYNISAGIFLPINVNAMPAMYLCFLSLKKNRKWSVEDLRFTNDVKSILHTILVKKITKNSLASSYSALDSILQNAGYGVAVSDMEKNSLLYTNETFEKMFSLDVDRMAIEEILFDKKYLLNELNGYFANGSQKWYDINFSNIKWVDGREVKLTTFYDITDLRSYQKRIEKQACEDLLTGLLNRQTYERDVNSEYHFYQKTGSEFAVLMIDLDDFANINEGSGSKVGDELLKFISSSINEISQIKGKVYRVGGDEFAVLVDHEIYKDLDLIVKRIRNLFDNPWVVDGVGYYCSMSMGGVKSSNVSDSVNILTRLSIALHDAKKNGKNQFMLYDENADVLAAKRLKIEQAMRRAVEEGCEEFEVYYQPIMEMVDGVTVCCGAEALCRWNSKEMGFVMPDEFIAIAEQLGLISEIGEKVLFAAAKRCKHWNDFGHPEFKVNINLSVIQLTRTDIVDTIRDAINFTGINPRNLTFEVTESLAINDMERMIAVLEQIRSLGCRVALDDFGTGYSSLSYIKNLPIDTIKIDKSFINDVTSDGFAEAFVKTVAELADSLDIDVCVEGVEHDNQLQMIDRFSVNLAQGFFFDRPITGEEFEDKYI